MQLCSSKLIMEFNIWKNKLFPCGIYFWNGWKSFQSLQERFWCYVCYVRNFLTKNRHALTNSCSKNCIEFARVGNAHEVQRRWRNCWQNMNKKKSFKKNNKVVFFVIHFVFLIAWLLKEICSLFLITFRNFDIKKSQFFSNNFRTTFSNLMYDSLKFKLGLPLYDKKIMDKKFKS